MAPTVSSPLFEGIDTGSVRDALRGVNGALLDELGSSLNSALHGSESAVPEYVGRYRLLVDLLLSEGRKLDAELVAVAGDGRLTVADSNGRPVRVWLDVLENASVDAPFLSWTTQYGLGEAVALELVSRMRAFMGRGVLTPPAEPSPPPVDDLAAERFQRRVRAHLSAPRDEGPLERLMRVFALSKSELGRLFGVSRQAVDGWLGHGLPADRQEKLATLLALADLLERKLKVDRIPGIARRPADAYGGKTMLELIAADRQSELLRLVRESFDWSQAA